MRKTMIIVALATLAACSERAAESETEADTADAAVAPEPVAVMAADGQPTPGMYRITTADGEVFMEDVRADGTYTQTTEAGEIVETGRWEQRSAQEYCYAVDEQYVDEERSGDFVCNTETVGEDGVWTSTNPEGQTSTVERVTS